jgi:hypothetical protein
LLGTLPDSIPTEVAVHNDRVVQFKVVHVYN